MFVFVPTSLFTVWLFTVVCIACSCSLSCDSQLRELYTSHTEFPPIDFKIWKCKMKMALLTHYCCHILFVVVLLIFYYPPTQIFVLHSVVCLMSKLSCCPSDNVWILSGLIDLSRLRFSQLLCFSCLGGLATLWKLKQINVTFK